MTATQQLNQQVLQRYGWSAYFDRDQSGYWRVTVAMGFAGNNRAFQRSFVSHCYANDQKQGECAASEAALRGLQGFIQDEERKPQMDLMQAFQNVNLPTYDSCNLQIWQHFWSRPPSCVGIDVEGNSITPPVLVQIATNDYCILEVPSGGFSHNLERLLDDRSIRKIFCDSPSHRDKYSLRFSSPVGGWEAFSESGGSIIDLEILANKHLGRASSRGLGRIATFCMPILQVKPNQYQDVSRFVKIEQGRLSPLRGVYDLSETEKRYASLDAWVTLQCYNEFQAMGYA